MYLARSFAVSSSGSVVIVDPVGARLVGGEATTVSGVTTAGELERLGSVLRPNTFFRQLRNPFKLDSLAVCGAPW